MCGTDQRPDYLHVIASTLITAGGVTLNSFECRCKKELE